MVSANILIRSVTPNEDGFTYRILGYVLGPDDQPNGEFIATMVDPATAAAFTPDQVYPASVGE